MGTGVPVPGVQMAVPATVAGMGFGGYGYGYGQKYPRVTGYLCPSLGAANLNLSRLSTAIMKTATRLTRTKHLLKTYLKYQQLYQQRMARHKTRLLRSFTKSCLDTSSSSLSGSESSSTDSTSDSWSSLLGVDWRGSESQLSGTSLRSSVSNSGKPTLKLQNTLIT
jgi:hypothetical protein